MEGQIYLITNKINGKKYVGQTYNYRMRKNKYVKFGYLKRFQEHLQKKNQTKYLSIDILKFGKSNFDIDLITICNPSLTNDLETALIEYFETLHPNGYNGNKGGGSFSPCEDTKKNISNTLKKYYSDDNIKKRHSQVHKNKFIKINKKDIENIEIASIKEKGSYKIIYMHIKYLNSNERIRRRYGGIHIDYEDSLERCKKDALELLKNDDTKLILNIDQNERENNIHKKKMLKLDGNVVKIQLRIHKMRNLKMTSVYVMTDKMKNWKNESIRFVFGGKKIPFEISYEKAIEFVNRIKNENAIIEDNANY